MKLQIDGQALRIRVDEAEFGRLLEWDDVVMHTLVPDTEFQLRLRPVAGGSLQLSCDGDDWRLDLPLPLLVDYRDRLPCRDGILAEQALANGAVLTLSFEVDVRDSVRVRGPHKRSAEPKD